MGDQEVLDSSLMQERCKVLLSNTGWVPREDQGPMEKGDLERLTKLIRHRTINMEAEQKSVVGTVGYCCKIIQLATVILTRMGVSDVAVQEALDLHAIRNTDDVAALPLPRQKIAEVLEEQRKAIVG